VDVITRRVLSVLARKCAWRGRGMRPRSKKPGAVSRPGGWLSFGEYAFLEDSRYTSQEGRERTCILRLLQRQSLNYVSFSRRCGHGPTTGTDQLRRD